MSEANGQRIFCAGRFPEGQVELTGDAKEFGRIADSGRWARYRFCPSCGSTISYTNEDQPGQIAVPLGAFADPAFPGPNFSVYEHRKHPWVEIKGADVQHESSD